jgi:hypothetical protein
MVQLMNSKLLIYALKRVRKNPNPHRIRTGEQANTQESVTGRTEPDGALASADRGRKHLELTIIWRKAHGHFHHAMDSVLGHPKTVTCQTVLNCFGALFKQ